MELRYGIYGYDIFAKCPGEKVDYKEISKSIDNTVYKKELSSLAKEIMNFLNTSSSPDCTGKSFEEILDISHKKIGN